MTNDAGPEDRDLNLGEITVVAKTGAEKFTHRNTALDFGVLDFWQWSSSDLLGNALRGVVAEFIVAQALGGTSGCRTEWDSCDLLLKGGIRIEVKSAAYLQSWKQTRLSALRFDIGCKLGWDAATKTSAAVAGRGSHAYVFCVLVHKDKQTVDPLNLDQWRFYVLPTSVLNERCPLQKTISLKRLCEIGALGVCFEELQDSVTEAAAKQ